MFDIDKQLVLALCAAAELPECQQAGHIGTVAVTAGILGIGQSRAADLLKFYRVKQEDLRQFVSRAGSRPAKLFDFQLPQIGKARMSQALVDMLSSAQKQMRRSIDPVGVDALLLTLLQSDAEVRQAVKLGKADCEFIIGELKALLSGEASPASGISSCSTGSCGGSDPASLPGARKSKTPHLDEFTVDLTALARDKKLMPVIGRSKEIARCMQILGRKTKNNPVLIGEPGVGKTAIVEGLAQLVAAGDVPRHLLNKRILQLDLTSMLAGCSMQGTFEGRMKAVIAESKYCGDVKIFVDELHTLIGAGGSQGGMNASNALKPALARGEFSMIGATTRSEYRRLIENADEAFARRIISVLVEPPSTDDTIAILGGLKETYESHHQVRISDAALRQAALLSDRYIGHRFLPDKAIDLIDEAGSRLVIKTDKEAALLAAANAEGKPGDADGKATVAGPQQDGSVVLLPAPQAATAVAAVTQINPQVKPREEWPMLDGNEIEELVNEITGIPLGALKEKDLDRYRKLEEQLHERVIGQREAVKAVSRAVRRSRVGLSDPNRPCVFLFLGPTGVGKTEVARALQEFLSGSEKDMVRLDMSEFMESHAVSTLVGAPPGYVGYDEGGKLTEAVRKHPYSVVLLDEIEKAHQEVYNLLLQIFEDGRLTDRSAQGQTVDFKNTIIILTSNIGAYWLKDLSASNRQQITDNVMVEVKQHFNPEFVNRLDEVICFSELNQEEIGEILGLMMLNVNKRLTERKIELTLDDTARRLVMLKGYDQEYGARPMRRAVQKYVEDAVTDGILDGTIQNDTKLVLTESDARLVVGSITSPEVTAESSTLSQ